MLTDPIAIESGLLSGVASVDGAVRSYKGIPFAAPPVGARRWRAPEPPAAWQGVYTADRFASACMQPLHGADHFMAQFGFADTPECGISEHCLFLNVWTSARSAEARLPVIVWVYGGGYRVGSGSHPVSDGEALARKGAVVVTVNYRLGGLGYFAHPELTQESGFSGNYACLDVLAALKWVQKNIAAFGGDPQCVTVFGQSAGGTIVNVLMASPLSQGLFHRAISHSAGRFHGGPMGVLKTREQAEQDGLRWMEKLGAKSLRDLRSLPPDQFYGDRGQWNVIVDGHVLRAPVQGVFERGEQLPVPLLVGFTRDDATPFPMAEWHTQAGLLAHAEKAWGDKLEAFRKLYPFDDDASAKKQSYAVRRDVSFAYQSWRFAELHHRKAPVYLFEFTHPVPLPKDLHFHEPTPPGGFGAYHGAELWYVFNTLQAKPWNWTQNDRRLADAVSSYWLSFAAMGKPQVAGLATWPEFDAAKRALLLGETIAPGPVSNQAALEFFSAHFAAKR